MVFPNICLFYTKICSSLRSAKKNAASGTSVASEVKSSPVSFSVVIVHSVLSNYFSLTAQDILTKEKSLPYMTDLSHIFILLWI